MIDLVDHDKADDWSDLLAVENPIQEAHDCGDGISFEVYSRQAPGVDRGHKDYVLDGGDLSEFDHCPHRWLTGFKEDRTDSTDWGSLIDCLLMNDGVLSDRFAIVPETYTSAKGEVKEWNFNATVCDEWRQTKGRGIGLTEVKKPLLEEAQKAAALIMADPQLFHVFKDSRRQVMITGLYDDKETGLRVPIKALLDLVPPDASWLGDFKTCKSAHSRAWPRQVFTNGYHEQAARHMDLWNAAHNETRSEFRHILQENFEPFEIGKRFLDPGFIDMGRRKYIGALQRYAQCLKTGTWPGYDTPRGNNEIVVEGFLQTSPEAWMVGG